MTGNGLAQHSLAFWYFHEPYALTLFPILADVLPNAMSERTYPRGEITRRGNALFEERICPQLDPGLPADRFVAIDIETGDYEVDEREVAATRRLTQRHPDAKGRICLRRIGSPAAYRLGTRLQPEG